MVEEGLHVRPEDMEMPTVKLPVTVPSAKAAFGFSRHVNRANATVHLAKVILVFDKLGFLFPAMQQKNAARQNECSGSRSSENGGVRCAGFGRLGLDAGVEGLFLAYRVRFVVKLQVQREAVLA